MEFCGLCGMSRSATDAVHLCTAEVVGLLSKAAGATA